ncbi:hypothetical protein AB0C77_12490 [Streptomyces sp. NPDC048629]|uniref:hypothetical protein n=1 Tax=Streptomyces sp. NPDC048629 TaxID=3154824 RepID=UPI003420A113
MAERPSSSGPHRRLMPGPLVLLVLAALVVAAVAAARDTLRAEDMHDHARRPAPATPGESTDFRRPGTPSPDLSAAGGDPARLPSPSPSAAGKADSHPSRHSASPTASTPPVTPGPRAERSERPRADGRRAAGEPVAFERLRVGDCFDVDREAPGTAIRRACDRPHDAEVVARLRLAGLLRTDDEVRHRAAELCRPPLRAKAAAQPSGTYWTTYVQYPYHSGYLLGSDTVVCSLADLSDEDGRLTTRLQ